MANLDQLTELRQLHVLNCEFCTLWIRMSPVDPGRIMGNPRLMSVETFKLIKTLLFYYKNQKFYYNIILFITLIISQNYF